MIQYEISHIEYLEFSIVFSQMAISIELPNTKLVAEREGDYYQKERHTRALTYRILFYFLNIFLVPT